MIKAVSALTNEYNDALRKYCRSKKAVVSNFFKDFFIYALIAAVIICDYLIANKLAVFPLACIIFLVILKIKRVRTVRKARNDLPRVIYDITVDGNKFTADSKRDVKDSTVKNTLHYEIDCDKLVSAKEGGGFFFIETEPNMYIIIGYSDIIEGSPEQLRQLLKDALGEKYKIFDK